MKKAKKVQNPLISARKMAEHETILYREAYLIEKYGVDFLTFTK